MTPKQKRARQAARQAGLQKLKAKARARLRAERRREAVDETAFETDRKPGRARALTTLAPARRRRAEQGPHMTVDIESKDGLSSVRAGFTRPFLTGLYDGETTLQWRNARGVKKLPWRERHLARGGCVDSLMRALLVKKYMGRRIYAHNGGAFDFLFLVAWLAKNKRFKFALTPQGPSILAVRIEKARAKKAKKDKDGKRDDSEAWTLIDSVRLLPMSLKQAAKSFGCETQKKDLPLNTPEKSKKWEGYHAADMVALYQCLERVAGLLEEQGGEMALTAPSAALKMFQRRFLKEPIARSLHEPDCKLDPCDGCAHQWVRFAYKGGRVEVFHTGAKARKLFYYDINSSYPAAMQYPMPVGPVTVIKEPKKDWSYYEEVISGGKWVGFARVTVTIPADCHIPPLPVHHPKTGKLCFPVGTFTGCWDMEEIKLLSLCPGASVVKVHRVYIYEAKPVFLEMVNTLYPLRDKRRKDFDEGLGKLVKLILNALYGKFGQRPEREEILYLPAGTPPEGAAPVGGDPFETDVWTVAAATDSAHILPQIAAHVTSLGRVRLFYLLRAVQDKGGTVYYCDTDAVIGDVELPESNELGRVKREYPCPNLRGSFVRPKVYRLECGCRNKAKCKVFGKDDKDKRKNEKLVAKGVPNKDVRGVVLDAKAWSRFTSGDKIHFRRLTKLRTIANAGMRTPWMVATHKSIRTAYDKRVVLEDGSTRPMTLTEDAPA